MDKNNFKLSLEYTAGDSTAIKNHYSITELELFANYFLITTVLEIPAQAHKEVCGFASLSYLGHKRRLYFKRNFKKS